MAMHDPFGPLLLAGERIQWSGRPSQGVIFSGRDAFLIPFSLIWCGFAIFWETRVITDKAPAFFLLWGAMFIAIGLFFVFGRFIVDLIVRRRTSYALTDRRVLISRTAPFGSFTALSLDRLPAMHLLAQSGGRGTIRFGEPPSGYGLLNQRGFGSWIASLDPAPQFIGIENAVSVFSMAQRMASASSAN